MEQRKVLGRGIASLIPGGQQTQDNGALREIPINQIRPCSTQPRKFFDEERITELAQSIQAKGIIHPLLVRTVNEGYELISGERRLRAAKQIGLTTVPVLVRDVAPKEQLELALIENLQREDLDPIEEARAFAELLERFEMTQEEVARQLGRGRSAIANSLRLLRLPEKVQEALQAGAISIGHAKVLLAEPIDRQLFLLDKIVTKKLSVRDLESGLAEKHRVERAKVRTGEAKTLPPALARILEEMRTRLGTQVRLEPKAKGGRIIIEYYSEEQLDELYQRLTGFNLTKRKIREI